MELFGSALLTDIAIRSLRCSLVALIEFVAAKIAAWHSGPEEPSPESSPPWRRQIANEVAAAGVRYRRLNKTFTW
jgi:hypothetical protein